MPDLIQLTADQQAALHELTVNFAAGLNPLLPIEQERENAIEGLEELMHHSTAFSYSMNWVIANLLDALTTNNAQQIINDHTAALRYAVADAIRDLL